MNNEQKQQFAVLEARVARLENTLMNFNESILRESYKGLHCNQCGAHEPINSNYNCNVDNCCMGLNPNDDLGGGE